MNKKVKIGGGGTFTITDKYYKAAGGEASIYVNGGRAFKIYHDHHKTLPAQKIQELSAIHNTNVVIPQDLIFDAADGTPLGYVAKYLDDVEPLLKLFTRTFKQDNNISPAMIVELVKQMQVITTDVHVAKCLIVDFNELNVLVNVDKSKLSPYFIDVDSYGTPSYRGTAIMDSVRDRKVSKIVNGSLVYNANELSDWFSFGILAFWLYTNIHPYRGSHASYKPKDRIKQMDDNVSVFHSGVKLPPTTNDFDVWIPPRHKGWFIDLFKNGNRSVPPLADGVAPSVVPAPIITIKGNAQIEVTQTGSYGENVVAVLQVMGINYVVTTKKIYCNNKELFNGCDKYKKVLLCPASDGTIIVASLLHNTVTFTDLIRQQVIGTIDSAGMIYRNGCIYTVTNGKVVENKFTAIGTKLIHRATEIENVSTFTTTIWEGCVIQNLLGKYYLVLPYIVGACFSKYLPQLDGYRIVDCKAERNVVVIIGESKGKFDRFIIVFTKKDYSEWNVRKVEDTAYDGINFTTTETGLTLLLATPDELEMFVNNTNINIIPQPPFDSAMRLFNTSDGCFFVNGNSIHKIKKK